VAAESVEIVKEIPGKLISCKSSKTK